MQVWPYADQLRSFDRRQPVPEPPIADYIPEIIHRGDRRAMRPRLIVSMLVAVCAAASCWWDAVGLRFSEGNVGARLAETNSRGGELSSRMAELDAQFQMQQQQLVALRELQEAHEEMSQVSADYGKRFRAQLDLQLADTIAARTLLHTATSRRDTADQGQLRLIVRHFAETEEAHEAAQLLGIDRL